MGNEKLKQRYDKMDSKNPYLSIDSTETVKSSQTNGRYRETPYITLLKVSSVINFSQVKKNSNVSVFFFFVISLL